MTRIGFITGVKKEAWILQQRTNFPKSDIICAGAGGKNSYTQATFLLKSGCEVLISIGVAGALNKSLNAGDLIIPRSVISKNGDIFEVDQTQYQKIISHLSKSFTLSNGPIFGSDTIISKATEKLNLNHTTGAIAVDMESLGVARAAQENNCPFLVVRTILDTAGQDLPTASLQAIDLEGNIRIGRVMLDIVKKPSELVDLIKLANNSRKAFTNLSRVAFLGFGL
jgi:adenosylhomocysteine nucleosidase